jgi:hypothetical protein
VLKEVDILLSYHFGEEGFKRHDPKKVVKENLNKIGLPWEYTSEILEEEEVHNNTRNYYDTLFKR